VNSEAEMTLPDGRRLGFASYGDPSGAPVFFLSGTLGSRREAALFHEAARRLRVHVVGVDRPGHGRSTLQRGRTFAGFADDLLRLADHLGFARFGLLGWSGGGAHAAAVAPLLKHRLTGLSLVASGTPPGLPGVHRARRLLVRFVIWLVRYTLVHLWLGIAALRLLLRWRGEAMLRLTPRFFFSPGDARMMKQPGFRRDLVASWNEGLQSGVLGSALDLKLQLLAWDVPLADPGCPVVLWYGAEDRICPPSSTQALAQVYANVTTRVLADEGHLTLGLHAEELLAPFAPPALAALAGT
jgi:pimeloyl-ACP methyl ester carboxylesterase